MYSISPGSQMAAFWLLVLTEQDLWSMLQRSVCLQFWSLKKKCSLFTLDYPVRILWRGVRVGGGKNKEMDGVTKRSWRRGLRDCCHRRLRIGLEKGLFKSIQESIMLFCRDAEEKITSWPSVEETFVLQRLWIAPHNSRGVSASLYWPSDLTQLTHPGFAV